MILVLSEVYIRKGYSYGFFIYMYIFFNYRNLFMELLYLKYLIYFIMYLRYMKSLYFQQGRYIFWFYLVMKMFNMENLEDFLKYLLLKDNIKYMQNKLKEEIFDVLMEEILDFSFVFFQFDVCGFCIYMYI